MDASRLLALLELLKQDLGLGYQQQLKELVSLFNQAQSTPGQNFYDQIEAKKTELFELLTSSSTNTLVPSRKAMLAALDGDRLFGQQAAAEIEEILARGSAGGPAAVAEGLTSFQRDLVGFQQNIASVSDGLASLHVEPSQLLGRP